MHSFFPLEPDFVFLSPFSLVQLAKLKGLTF